MMYLANFTQSTNVTEGLRAQIPSQLSPLPRQTPLRDSTVEIPGRLGMTGDEDCDCANPSPTPLGKIAAEPLHAASRSRAERTGENNLVRRSAWTRVAWCKRGVDLRAGRPPPAVCALTVRACARGSAEGKARYFPYSCCDRRSRVNRLPGDCRNRNLRGLDSGLRCPGPGLRQERNEKPKAEPELLP